MLNKIFALKSSSTSSIISNCPCGAKGAGPRMVVFKGNNEHPQASRTPEKSFKVEWYAGYKKKKKWIIFVLYLMNIYI